MQLLFSINLDLNGLIGMIMIWSLITRPWLCWIMNYLHAAITSFLEPESLGP